MGMIGGWELLILLQLLYVPIWWKVLTKTGNSGWLGCLTFVPGVNLVMLLLLVFSEWPIHKEMRTLREQLGHSGQRADRQGQGSP